MRKIVWISLFWILSANTVAQQQIKNFTSGSYQQIVKQYNEQPFVMVLWSLDCPPCYKELEMLGRFSKKHPELDLVLVSTDSSASQDELLTVLKRYKLENTELWVFSGDSDQRLRFEIDRSWYGELPRSYLIKWSEKKQVVSGLLSEEKLIEMISNNQ